MSSDKFKDFQQEYPNLFKEYPRSGFALEPGWEELVHNLCSVLEYHISHLPEEIRPDVFCAQLKEKFGTLRMYMCQETPYISGAIKMAGYMSAHICQVCGERGKIRQDGWVETLCDSCHEKNIKK